MRLRFPRTVLPLLLLLAPFARAEFRVTFEVTEEIMASPTGPGALQPPSSAAPPAAPRTYVVEAIVGPTAQRTLREERLSLTEFGTRQGFRADLTRRTYEVGSLYADIGFRTAEMANRFMMRKMFEAAGVRDVRFHPTLIEHLFALRTAETTPLVPETTADRMTFSAQEQRLYSGTLQGRELSESEAREFARWLRYEFPMHPDVLEAIQRRRVLPAEFEVWRHDMKVVRFRVRMTGLERGVAMPNRTAQLAGLKEVPGEIGELIAPANALSAAEFQARTQALLAAAQQHGKDKQYLDCMLGLMEWMLCTGKQPVEDLRRFNQGISSDPDAIVVRQAVKPQTKETALDIVKALQPIEARTAYPHIVQIFEANNLTVTHSVDEAIKRFRNALRQNPCIVGAWKDLGDLCYLTYNMRDAWRCWDTGRRLNPDYPQFQRVNDLEDRLQKEHPEFF